MQDRQRQHAVLGIAEEAANTRRADLAGLEVEQTGDHLQVVLHPVMDFTQHMVALLEARAQLRLAAGDRLGHRPDAFAHRGEFGRPRGLSGKLDVLAAGDAVGEILDVAQRPHAPAIGAQPDRQQRTARAPARPQRTRPTHRSAPGQPSATPAALTTKIAVVGERQQVEFMQRAVLAVVAERRLAADDRRDDPRRRPAARASPMGRHRSGRRCDRPAPPRLARPPARVSPDRRWW